MACNAHLPGPLARRHVSMTSEAEELLGEAVDAHGADRARVRPGAEGGADRRRPRGCFRRSTSSTSPRRCPTARLRAGGAVRACEAESDVPAPAGFPAGSGDRLERSRRDRCCCAACSAITPRTLHALAVARGDGHGAVAAILAGARGSARRPRVPARGRSRGGAARCGRRAPDSRCPATPSTGPCARRSRTRRSVCSCVAGRFARAVGRDRRRRATAPRSATRSPRDLGRGVAAAGLVVVSGAAIGIDAARTARPRSTPAARRWPCSARASTSTYPAANAEAPRARSRQRGTRGQRVPARRARRSRSGSRRAIGLIAGLASALVVVEGAARSGSR